MVSLTTIMVMTTIKVIVLSKIFQKNENVYIYTYFLIKFIIIIICGYLAYYVRFNSFSISAEYQLLTIVIGLIGMIIEFTQKRENFYSYSLFQFLQKDVMHFIYALIVIVLIGALSKYTAVFSRLWLGIFIFLTLSFFILNKIIFNFYHKKVITKSKYFIKNVMLVGNTNECLKFFKTFKNKRYHLKLICISDPTVQNKKEINVPHIYLDDNLSFNIKYHKINQVWIISSNDYSRKPLIDKFASIPVDIITVEDTIGISDLFMEKVDHYSLYQTSFTPFYGEGYIFKIIFDFIVSLILIIILSPILIITALMIYLEDGRPIIFKQSRHGWDGYAFTIYKFRSLKNSDNKKFKQVQKNDNRYLRVGRIIRRLSIDELPQLFNVLKGDMSLVGPRPHALANNDEFSQKLRGFMQRHRCKPGITGLAQISGYRGITDTDDKMKGRYEFDLKYIENWSFLLDIRILIKTAFTFLFHNAD